MICFYAATLKTSEAGSFGRMVSLVWVDVADLQLKLAQMWRLRSLRWLIPVPLCPCASQHFAYSSKTQLQSKFLSQNSCKHFRVKARSQYQGNTVASVDFLYFLQSITVMLNGIRKEQQPDDNNQVYQKCPMQDLKFMRPCFFFFLFFLSADVWSHLDHRMVAMEPDHTMSWQLGDVLWPEQIHLTWAVRQTHN